ncbi:bacteriocin [Oculatella sp. LEGE 06141]|uniref:bacteriocin n=1 Tax=Oculatella sp. LEGE 06141 TaxID=1828648 RepID=UPI0018820AD2|nr:bacteriocin [Oculatella sp. LEGE 06141]MBE9182951.1 bacteriocin [Oculatella sp. LEGE 06141]
MQVQNQTQQIAEEPLLSLSEDELASITGGCPRPNPLDEARRQLLRRRTGLWRYP